MGEINPREVDFFDKDNNLLVPIGISNHHVHISAEDLETLFGQGYQLTILKDLSQPGQFACKETVNVVGLKSMIEKVRILGPVRPKTQVEVAQTDARKLGLRVPLRNSGDIVKTPGCVLVGPCGYVVIKEGVIVSNPHIHMHTSDAEKIGIKDRELVDVLFSGEKFAKLYDVLARVHDEFSFELHIDTDEANAFRVKNGAKALILKQNQ